MIRRFYLQNQSGNRFYFDYRSSCLISNLSGLGFQKDFTFLSYDQFYDRVDETYPLTDIQATLVFLRGYSGYADFLDFLKLGDKEMLFYYESNDTAYCQVEIKSLTKSEIKNGALQSELILQKKSLWLKSQVLTIDVNVINQGKVYPFQYPYRYSVSFEGKIKLTNRGIIPAPLVIEINGAVDDPEVLVLKNGQVVSVLRLYLQSNEGDIIVSSIPNKQFMFQISGNVKTSIYDKQDFTEDNFLFIDPGEYELEFRPGVSSETKCRIQMLEGFLGV
jgi:hypothetical protein